MPNTTKILCRECHSSRVLNLGIIPKANIFAGQLLKPAWPGGNLYLCQECHLGFRHPIHKEDEYSILYEKASVNIWTSQNLRPDQVRVRNIIASKPDVTRVLDIGCYDGALLNELGPLIKKFGVEPCVSAANLARKKGINIISKDINELENSNELFDVIYAVDVIEHLAKPDAFINKMIRLLSPSGLIIISSGSLDTKEWLQSGGRYWYSSIPEHISFISPSWGKEFARKNNINLREIQTFPYLDLDINDLPKIRRNYRLKVIFSNLEIAISKIFSWSPAHGGHDRICGRPGAFDDHVILVFSH